MDQDPVSDSVSSEGATILRSVPCAQCRYDLRGLPLDGPCPECGLDIGVSVLRAVDPAARRLPRLRDPRGVGDALVWLLACLLSSTFLLVIRPVVLLLDRFGATGAWIASRWTPPELTLVAGVILLIGLGAVRKLMPPAERDGRDGVRREVWMLAIGLTVCGFLPIAGWLTHRFLGGIPSGFEPSILHLLMVVGFVFTMIGLRGVFRVIGERSREYRTARGGRQRTTDMIAAALGIGAGEVLRLFAVIDPVGKLAAVGTVVIWISTLMLLIGLCYLLVNAWWIRQSLRRPALSIRELVSGPGTAVDHRPGPFPDGEADVAPDISGGSGSDQA